MPSASSEKTGISILPRAWALKGSSPVKRIPSLNAAWPELYCTVGLVLRQPRRVPEIFRAIGMWVSEITQGRG